MTDEPTTASDDSPFASALMHELARELDVAAATAEAPWNLLQRAYAGSFDESPENDLVRSAVQRGLAYDFVPDQPRRGDLDLGVRFSSAHGDWPPAVSAVSASDRSTWADIAAMVKHPLLRAHFADLALQTGGPASVQTVRMIASAYLEVAKLDSVDDFHKATSLWRAYTLARRFAIDEQKAIRLELWNLARRFTEDGAPIGVLLRPFDALAEAPAGTAFEHPTRAEVAALLAVARDTTASATLFESVATIAERLAETQIARETIRRELVEGYLRIGLEAQAMLRSHWLEQAASTAQRFGLVDLRDRAIELLQAGSVEDLGMQTIAAEVRLPRYVLDARLAQYRRARDVLSAVGLWLTSPSPTGRHQENLRQAEATAASSITSLVTRTVYNERGLPIRTTAGPESAVEENRERIESWNAAVNGTVLAHELDAIRSHLGSADAESIGAYLCARFDCDASLALGLGRAMEAYWSGRYDDAGRAAFPLVEAGARGLLLSLGQPLYRIQTGGRDGRFPSIETYADRLAAADFDPDWLHCLLNPVARLRNALAHGHRLTLEPSEAAILLRMAALLVVLTPMNASADSREHVAERLRQPVRWAAGRLRLVRRWRRAWVPRVFLEPEE